MDEKASRPDRTLIVIASVIAVLVIVALIVVFTRDKPPLLDASTPEGVVQRYSAAVIAGDEPAATEFLSDRAREDCDRIDGTIADDIRVTLVSTTVRDDSADVRVALTISYGGGGPFGDSGYETEEEFDLVKEDGTWRIDAVPWPLTICADPGAR